MALEKELKYLEPDLDGLRAALVREGADHLAGPYFEENLVFDYEDRSLKARGLLLRLRRKGGGDALLTVKRPADAPDGNDTGAGNGGALKVYEESQMPVPDFGAMRDVLEALGYSVAFRYEKVREKWRLGGVTVCLDELPFGAFVELEGSEEGVPAAARALDLAALPTSRATYHELNRRHRRAAGLEADENFVFEAERRQGILAAL